MVAQRLIGGSDVGKIKVMIGAVIAPRCSILRPAFAFPRLIGCRLGGRFAAGRCGRRFALRSCVAAGRRSNCGFSVGRFVQLEERVVAHCLGDFLSKIKR